MAKKVTLAQSRLLAYFPRFVVYLAILHSIAVTLQLNETSANFIQQYLALTVEKVVRFLGYPITVHANNLMDPTTFRYVVVDNECTGLLLLASVLAALLALNKSPWHKLATVLIATGVMQLENLSRIVHLYIEMTTPNNNFDFYHLYVWQAINFVTALLVLWTLDKLFRDKTTND